MYLSKNLNNLKGESDKCNFSSFLSPLHWEMVGKALISQSALCILIFLPGSGSLDTDKAVRPKYVRVIHFLYFHKFIIQLHVNKTYEHQLCRLHLVKKNRFCCTSFSIARAIEDTQETMTLIQRSNQPHKSTQTFSQCGT